MTLADRIATGLGVPASLVSKTARRASYLYKIYEIPKRSGGNRTICQPSRLLKTFQRWLVGNVILAWPVHEAVKSYRKNVTIKDNAKCHAASNFLLRVDLKDFFQSIKAHDIVSHLHVQHPDWSEDDIDLFRQLVCRRGQLTIGAPSSPAISNAICYEMDLRLAEHAKQNKSTYTRYADDLFFSTDAPDVLRHFPDAIQAVLNGLPRPRSLLLNPEKTRHSSRRGRRRVTGLTLGSDGNVHLGRALKRTIRARIHTLKALDERERTALAGLIAYAQMIDPDFISALVLKYGPAKVQEACQR